MILNSIRSIEEFAKYFELFETSISISPCISEKAKEKLQQKFKECNSILMNEVAKDVQVNEPIILS